LRAKIRERSSGVEDGPTAAEIGTGAARKRGSGVRASREISVPADLARIVAAARAARSVSNGNIGLPKRLHR